MALRQLPSPKAQFFKSNGDPLSGGKIYTYEAGTTTAKDTYTDSTGDTANANPVILDSRGEASIWWDGVYKVVVKDANDVTLYTLDNHGTGLDPVAVPQLSLVKNYSFETATADEDTPDNWTITLYTDGTQILDDSALNQTHGAKSIKFTSAGSGGGYAESDLFPVHALQSIGMLVAMKSSVATVRNVIEIVWYDRSQSLLSTTSLYDDSSTNPTGWEDQSLNATAPAFACFARIRLTGCHSSDSTVGSTWFDDVRVGLVASMRLLMRTNANDASESVTIPSVTTELVELDLGTVVAGDQIEVFARLDMTKGGTTGTNHLVVEKKSGTAVIRSYSGLTNFAQDFEGHPINVGRGFTLNGKFHVTTGGTLVIKFSARSDGSDGSGVGYMDAVVLRGD